MIHVAGFAYVTFKSSLDVDGFICVHYSYYVRGRYSATLHTLTSYIRWLFFMAQVLFFNFRDFKRSRQFLLSRMT